MGVRLRSWWRQIQIHSVRTVLIALLSIVVVLIILSILGYIFNWGWTGPGPYISSQHPKDSDFQRGKTLWDWLQLLIIPAVLAVAGYLINVTISKGEQAATEQRAKSEREAADKRAETEREIALDNQREIALKEYIDKMSELILHEGLLELDPKKEVRETAQIQTLTVLHRLDGKRKGSVVKFLNDAGLIKKYKTVISLDGADLRGAILSDAFLNGVRLQYVDLSRANLSGVRLGYYPLSDYPDEELEDLEPANLLKANLSGANLRKADLRLVDLQLANLTEANLSEANLSYADLSRANLNEANLYATDLMNTDLRHANLKGVTGITEEELKEWAILK